jgi:CRISPR-associated protein Cmr1
MEFHLNRFKDLEKVNFTCEVITPMFLGGADGKSAELRTASIKGDLRFWWRALYGGDDINGMKKREGEIFGSTEEKSNLIINIHNRPKPVLNNLPKGEKFKASSNGKTFLLSIIDYLAYGLYEYKKGNGNIYNKEHFIPNSKFEIEFKFNKQHEKEILNSFNVLVFFGGLGSRSRNGFGSFDINDIENDLKINFKNNLSKFTAFSKYSTLFLFNIHNSWVDALSEIGLAYKDARLSLESKHNFDKRALVAMPIEVKGEKNISKHVKNGRHAKPYFLHVNKLKNGKFRGQILFMPYNYFKQDEFNEYLEVCSNMNNVISKKAKEVRDEF